MLNEEANNFDKGRFAALRGNTKHLVTLRLCTNKRDRSLLVRHLNSTQVQASSILAGRSTNEEVK